MKVISFWHRDQRPHGPQNVRNFWMGNTCNSFK